MATETTYEFRTVRITAASACRGNNRSARRRSRELADATAGGWEQVGIEPERFMRRGDKVTLRRPARPAAATGATSSEVAEPVAPQTLSELWRSWTPGARAAVVVAVAFLALALTISSISS